MQGELAESWKIDPEFKEFVFRLIPDAKFSYGTVIDGDDLARSISFQIKHNHAIHYDFSKIRRVSVPEKNVLKIGLYERSPNFLIQLTRFTKCQSTNIFQIAKMFSTCQLAGATDGFTEAFRNP